MIQQWWHNLAVREQRIVAISGTVLGLVLCYQLIISPIHRGLANMRTTVKQDQELSLWMKDTAAAIQQQQNGSISGSMIGSETLLTTTAQSVKNSPISSNLSSIEQNANNTLDVKFAQVSFDALTQWLVVIRQQYGIQTKQLSINRLNDQGLVQANLVLEASH